jgi:hypothetical protein
VYYEQDIPLEIQRLTGIVSAKEGKLLSEVIKEIEFIQDYPIFCHNAEFEKSFLKDYLPRAEFIDTVYFFMLLFPTRESYSLESLTQDLFIKKKEDHRGLEDSLDLFYVLQESIDPSKKSVFLNTPYEFLFDIPFQPVRKKLLFNKESFEQYFSQDEKEEAFAYVKAFKTKDIYLKRSQHPFIFRQVTQSFFDKKNFYSKNKEKKIFCYKLVKDSSEKYFHELHKEDVQREASPWLLQSKEKSFIEQSSCEGEICSYFQQCSLRKPLSFIHHQMHFFEKEYLNFESFSKKHFDEFLSCLENPEFAIEFMENIFHSYEEFLISAKKNFDYWIVSEHIFNSFFLNLVFKEDSVYKKEGLFYVDLWTKVLRGPCYFYKYKQSWSFRSTLFIPFSSSDVYFLDTKLPLENSLYYDFLSLLFKEKPQKCYLSKVNIKLSFSKEKISQEHLSFLDKDTLFFGKLPFLPKNPWMEALRSLYEKKFSRKDFLKIRLGLEIFRLIFIKNPKHVVIAKSLLEESFCRDYLFPLNLDLDF